MRAQRLAAIVGTSLLVLLGAACADDDGDTTTAADDTTTTTEARTYEVDDAVVERVARAAGQTVEEGTAHFHVMIETEGTAGQDGQQPIEVDGEVDFEEERRRLTFSGPEGDLDAVIDGEVVYIELPATEGDDWMRVELEALFDTDIGFGGPAAMPFQDPANNLRVLEASVIHAQENGEEQIRGESTTRFDMVIDLEQAAAEAEEGVQDAVDRMIELTGVEELEVEVWVDDDDLIRRVAYRIDLSQAQVREQDDEASVEADPEGLVTVTTEYFDFGTEVDVDIPDEDAVIDLDEEAVRESIGGAAGGGTTTTTAHDGTTTTTTADDDTTTTTAD